MRQLSYGRIAACLALCLVASLCAAAGCGGTAPERVSIGIYRGEMSLPYYVARDRGYFTGEGLEVSLREYESGVAALEALLAGEVELAACGEFVFVNQSFAHEDLRVIASVDEADVIQFVARKDSGITGVDDLSGKRIAVVPRSQAEYFLARSLEGSATSIRDIEQVDMNPNELEEAITGGRVDAVVVWEPIAGEIKKQLAENAVSWSAQIGQRFYWTLVTRERMTSEQPDVIERLLSSLAEADSFINENELVSREIGARSLRVGPGQVDYSWLNYVYQVTLDQPLLSVMEDEARWCAERGLAGADAPTPNYLERIYFDGLEAVDPDAAGIVHPGER